MLEAKNITAFYGKKQVLFDASIKAGEGEKVLLVGPNGAGKSTLLKVLFGLLAPSEGNIYFKGRDITSLNAERRVMAGIGYLMQSENIVPGLTVDENLELGGYSVKKEIFMERKEIILQTFDFLKDRLDMRAGYLSGGERQSLAIGMVLMKRPSILLLDEPSAGLSPKAASRIIEQVGRIQKDMGIKAVCMVEHNLKLALEWADRVYIMANGTIAGISSDPKALLDDRQELERLFFSSG